MKNDKFIKLTHPLIEHNFALLRDKNASCENFRAAIKKISYFLFVEATKNLKTQSCEIETPLQKMNINKIDANTKIVIAPILRAGLIFTETALEFLPMANVQHLGMYRNEETLQPVWYMDKTDEFYESENTLVFILDPMLATGNSANEAIKLFVKKGINQENIVFISLISAPEGVQNVQTNFPNVTIVTAAHDEKLNERGYILPGLGDAGDRIFNT